MEKAENFAFKKVLLDTAGNFRTGLRFPRGAAEPPQLCLLGLL